jgi:hypothetical protein
MKRTVFVGALVGALAASTAFAQSSRKGGQTANEGHTAPKQQPLTEAAPAAPDGSMALGTVHIPRAVKANGQPLAAGTYQVRLTPDNASPVAKGATASSSAGSSSSRAARWRARGDDDRPLRPTSRRFKRTRHRARVPRRYRP